MIKPGSREKGRAGVDAVVRAALTSSNPHTVAGDSLSSEQASLACFAGLAPSTANDHRAGPAKETKASTEQKLEQRR